MANYYKFKQEPYKHQRAALKKLIANGWGGALLMQPRTGKTKVCVDYASILHLAGKNDRTMIVCPAAIIDVWIAEFKANCPVKYRITVWDRKGRKKVDLPRFGSGRLEVVILNYDAFSTPARARRVKDPETGKMVTERREDGSVKRMKRRGGRYEIIQKLRDWQPNLIVLDESHRIKTRSARKTDALIRLGPVAQYRVIATGTAVTKAKRVFDLYAQWKFLNPESPLVKGHDSASFKERFGQWTTRNGFPQWIGEKNPKTLHRLVHAESFSVSRDECYDLPAAYPDQIIRVPLEESGKAYDQMAEEMIAMIESGEVSMATIKLTQNLRFSQITSGIASTEPTEQYPEGRIVRIGREKLRALEDLLTDWLDQDEKVVVCARFVLDIEDIAKLCRKLKGKLKVEPYILRGGQKRAERTKAIDDFRKSRGPAVFIMNPQAGSMGIDLRTASTMVWYSLTQSFVDYSQARDRIALSGKANRYYFLLAEGTYDELQYEGLGQDKEVVEMIHESPDRLRRNFKPT